MGLWCHVQTWTTFTKFTKVQSLQLVCNQTLMTLITKFTAGVCKAFSLRCQKFLHLNSSECARCKSHRTVLYFFSQAQRCINLIAIHSNGSQRQSKCPFTSRWFPENRQWDNTLGHLILQWLKDQHYGTMRWGVLPSDGTHVKQINGFIPVPSVNLLAVSKDMQTNFIHQKQKISLSGKTCFFFFLWKNVNTKDKICSSSWASYAFLCSV